MAPNMILSLWITCSSHLPEVFRIPFCLIFWSFVMMCLGELLLFLTWARFSVCHFNLEIHLIAFHQMEFYFLIFFFLSFSFFQFSHFLEILRICCWTSFIDSLISLVFLFSSFLSSYYIFWKIPSILFSNSLLDFYLK